MTNSNYTIPNNILSTENSKTTKGEKLGITTYISYLAPHVQNSKGINLCSHASKGCAKACLFKSGAARFDNVQLGKINKTEYFLHNKIGYMNQLVKELARAERLHDLVVGEKQLAKNGVDVLRYKKFAVRLNGTTDIPFEKVIIEKGMNIFDAFPNVQFYDYTKNPIRMKKYLNGELAPNYHLTFSRSEDNDTIVDEILSLGGSVAIVFGIKDISKLPITYKGYKVINGDETDLRFLDEPNVIVGLKYKLVTGKGTKGQNKDNIDNNDFLIDVESLTTESFQDIETILGPGVKELV